MELSSILLLIVTCFISLQRISSQRSKSHRKEDHATFLPEYAKEFQNGGGGYDSDSSQFASHGYIRKENRPKKHPQLLRDKKPNIILILTDDQDIELGSMNFMPKTLKILGENGAHLSNAYVTTPMCCPSRSSMLTGLYVHNHNVHTNNDNCSSPSWQQEHETRSFATYLNNAGYRTAYFGKYLNEYNGSYIPPGWREWVALIRNSRFYNYSLNANGNKIKHGDDYFRDYYPDLITNDSISFLRRSKRHLTSKPIMMVLSYPSPHGPEDAAPQFQHLFHNVTSHRTPTWNFAPNPDKQWLLRHTGQMEPIHVKFTDVLHTKRLQTLQTVDEAVEKLYRELRDLKELENTYIFYTSDHGYHLGQYGLVKGKSMPFEFDVRVPFYVRGPKVPKGVRIQDAVLNIDLAPTFLDIAGVDIPDHMDGRSILPLLRDNDLWTNPGHRIIDIKRKKPWRDSFLIERGVVNGQRKLARQNHLYPSLSPMNPRVTKDQRLAIQCRKPQFSSPCKPNQKWECIHDGYRWRIQKCRLQYPCFCPENNEEEFRRKPDTLKKRKHIRQIGDGQSEDSSLLKDLPRSRWKRFALSDDFDVKGIEQLYLLLDVTIGNKTELKTFSEMALDDSIVTEWPTDRERRESIPPFYSDIPTDCLGNRSCVASHQTPGQWHERKEKLDGMIKKLKQKLQELKIIRKQLKKTKPHKNQVGQDSFEVHPFQKTCVCDSQDNFNLRARAKEERQARRERDRQLRREEQQKRIERKMRRKNKFQNMTCNAEKMNCFTQDNDHWKTPPLWTEGPFCFCQNANNNTFWCLRTINDTHNFLYCEFVTGFITYYDLLKDPYQMRNAVYDLDYTTLERMRMNLNKLRSCKGSKDCTIRNEGPRHQHKQRAAMNTRNRPLRHGKSESRWNSNSRERFRIGE